MKKALSVIIGRAFFIGLDCSGNYNQGILLSRDIWC